MKTTQSCIKSPANFRDLGGMTGIHGKKVRFGRLLRSGGVTDLTSDDITLLQDSYPLAKIIDFRSSEEVTHSPDVTIPGSEYIHLDIFADVPEIAPTKDYMKRLKSPQMVDEFMLRTYELLVTAPACLEKYTHFLRLLLATSEGAVLFHCQAGKDRTGIGAAIILSIFGVSRDDIFTDYLLTNEMRQEANLKLLDTLKEQGVPSEKLEVLLVALQVKEEYLQHAFSTIETQYGSMDLFIRDALQMTADEIKQFQTMFLE